MKNCKKVLSLLLSVILCMALLVPVMAAEIMPEKQTNTVGGNAIIDQNGTLWMWGFDGYGQLGQGKRKDSTTRVKVMEDVASVTTFGTYVAAIKTDESLWTWGSNQYGMLGNGYVGNKTEKDWNGDYYPIQTVPLKIMDNVVAVSGGAALKEDGTVWTWGINTYGQLGHNQTDGEYHVDKYQSVPVKAFDHVKALYDGAFIKEDNSLWLIWDSKTGAPKKIMDNVAVYSQYDVGVGLDGSPVGTRAVVKTDGTLWTWGKNNWGQLGIGTTSEYAFMQTEPVKVMDDVSYVKCSGSTIAAIKTDGTLWMWGSNEYGQLGNGGGGNVQNKKFSYQTTPIKVMDDVNFVDFSGGTIAVKNDGSVWMWGGYEPGKESVDMDISSTTPVRIEGITAKLATVYTPTTSAAPSPTPGIVGSFTDVKTSDYFAKAVTWAVDNKVTFGTTTTTFSPYDTCTEWQTLQLIYRALGSPKVDDATLTEADRSYLSGLTGEEYDLVAWFMSKNVAFVKADPSITGVVSVGSGYDSVSLAKKRACQRIKVLEYLCDLSNGTKNYETVADWFVPTGNFADLYASIPTYVPNDLAAMEAAQRASISVHTQEFKVVAWAIENNISAGTTETTFSPYDTCTRAQIVSFLYRYFVEQGLHPTI